MHAPAAESIHRSGLVILSCQLDDLYAALEGVVAARVSVGRSTAEFLKNLETGFLRLISGSAVDNWPRIDAAKLKAGDALARVAVMRGTIRAFLTPEQIEEKRQTVIGFPMNGTHRKPDSGGEERPKPRRNMMGAFSHLGVSISKEDFDEARREMWSGLEGDPK